MLSHEKYLDLPTHIGHSKKKAFAHIKDHIAKTIKGWLGRNLSWVGREVLVKAVAQSIPAYAISVFKLPRDFCQDLRTLINRFDGVQKRARGRFIENKSCACQK